MYILPLLTFSLLGALCGSFVGVIAERAYTGQSWKRGRSKCNSCREVLTVRDLIPVFSWVFYRGRCRRCRVRLPVRYVAFEFLMAVLFAISYQKLGLTIDLFVFLVVLCVLGFIVIYDLRHTVVPRASSNLLIVLSVLFAVLHAASPHALLVHLMIALGIAAFFFLLHYFSRGRAMGLGDTPVVFALAMLVGSAALPGLMFSFWIGAVVGLGILFMRKGGPRMGIEVPFVPFLAVGYLLAFFTLWNPLPFLL